MLKRDIVDVFVLVEMLAHVPYVGIGAVDTFEVEEQHCLLHGHIRLQLLLTYFVSYSCFVNRHIAQQLVASLYHISKLFRRCLLSLFSTSCIDLYSQVSRKDY